MPSAVFNHILSYIVPLSGLFSLLKLWQTGLYQRYRALSAFLLFLSIYCFGILLFHGNYSSVAYEHYWEIMQPLTWLFSVLVVLELYSLILERHKGLATFGRWIQYAGFTLSTVVSLLVMLPRIETGRKHSSTLVLYYFTVERGVDCGMLVFLLFILIWLTQYPVPLSRNVVVHSFVYSALFLSNTLGTFAQVFLGYQLSTWLSQILQMALVLCLVAWLLLLTRKGEEIRVSLPQYSAEHEETVLRKLETLNRALLQVSRKN
jgi:hypothetical protein